ncbi:hypothetical protein ACFVP8_03915 [Viridibacillus arvi]|uniref:hypothetical protein n=1 Tax=Viridibacillus arvi TaxID=263475 RepID=UPI00367E0065
MPEISLPTKTTQDAIRTAVDNVNANVGVVKNTIDNVNTNVNTVKNNTVNIESRVTDVQSKVNTINSNVSSLNSRAARPIFYQSQTDTSKPIMASANGISRGANDMAVVFPYLYSISSPVITSVSGKGRILGINNGGNSWDGVYISIDGIKMEMSPSSGGYFDFPFASNFTIYKVDHNNNANVQVLYELY